MVLTFKVSPRRPLLYVKEPEIFFCFGKIPGNIHTYFNYSGKNLGLCCQ